MKRLLFVLLLTGCAEMATTEVKDTSKVFDAPGMTKAHIFEKANLWAAETFRASKSVIQYASKKEGVIVGKGKAQITCPTRICGPINNNQYLNFTLRIDIKEEKYRVSIKRLSKTNTQGYEDALREYDREEAARAIADIETSLSKYMTAKSTW